ncbi:MULTISPECIES: hypothetical protein [Lactobacillales]|nr:MULTISPECIES: hypothetical protein [Lactobacillales]MDU5442749.1 hypothetical protein [Finegoldia magna]NSO50001.1 hypothetical protein [Enterococcus faecalis]MCW0947112.1 hypothetical protein [Streptococcus anginosus]MDK6652237.1 hypothetical protein [Aerococcus urinae]MDK8485156.1 hypothetical protein [Aerococcus urinae]
MRRRFVFMTIVIAFLIVLTSCRSKKKEDKIEIFDSNNVKIAETEKQEELDYFSNFIEMSVENVNDKKFDNYFKEIPDDAIKSYHFIFTNGNEGTKIDFYIYENYPYITMEGVPMITTPLTWELSKEDLKEFNDKVQELKDLDNKR